MIKRKEDMTQTVKVHMRGGDGQAVVTDILDKGEYKGSARLLGTIRLEPGCSIGAHVHENEEEVFYVIEGTATYYDNGKTVEVAPGDVAVCRDGEIHSLANEGSEPLVFIAVILYS